MSSDSTTTQPTKSLAAQPAGKPFGGHDGMKIFEDEFERLERSTRGGMIEFKFSGIDAGEPPLPLHEPNDMLVVASPCHPWEPLKVDEASTKSLRCLICGAEFAVE